MPPTRVLALPCPPNSLIEADSMLGGRAPVLLDHQWPSEPKRSVAHVWLGHAQQRLHLVALLPDAHVVTQSTAANQRMWELGDTFEMFFQSEDSAAYYEFHVTPTNHRLQLRLPSIELFAQKRQDGAFEEFLLPEPSFRSEVEIIKGAWVVYAAIRGELVSGEQTPLAGQTWRFSFCRYDYDSVPGEPILSSSSPHRELDFHRLHEWKALVFEP